MTGVGGQRVNLHAGRAKYFISSTESDFTHFNMNPGGRSGNVASLYGKQQREPTLTFEIGEPRPLGISLDNRAFNVLYVQTPKPAILNNPYVKLLVKTAAEAWEMVATPIFRFGIPKTSIKEKCPYWRDDGSYLRTTPHQPLSKVIKTMETGSLVQAAVALRLERSLPGGAQQEQEAMEASGRIKWPWEQKKQQVEAGDSHGHTHSAAGWHHSGNGHSGGHGHGHGHGHGQYLLEPASRWVVPDLSLQLVVAVNVALWTFLATSGGRG